MARSVTDEQVVLVVEDNEQDAKHLRAPFPSESVEQATDLVKAVAKLARWPHLVILDMFFPEDENSAISVKRRSRLMAGNFLKAMKKSVDLEGRPWPDVIIVSSEDDEQAAKLAVEYLRSKQVREIIPKSLSWSLFEEVLAYKSEELRRLRRLRPTLEDADKVLSVLSGLEKPIITNSPSMIAVGRTISKVANSTATVLIEGESGTGKDPVARAIHELSSRPKTKFESVDCGAVPEPLMELEFLGCGPNSGISGAPPEGRPGIFERAHEGSVFLDEIGHMPHPLQISLLRLIQEKEVRRLGGTAYTKVDVRIIAATSKDLRTLVDEGKFLPELYYRINVIPIRLPPLRERKDDIELLLPHFLDRFNIMNQRDVEFSADAIRTLKDHEWPGNVRELENVIQRIVLLHEGEAKVSRQEVIEALSNSQAKAPPGNHDLLLVKLNSTEIAKWSDIRENDVGYLKTILQNRLQEPALDSFVTKVIAAGNDPAPIHYYKALLYLVLRHDHKCDKEDLKTILGLKEAQVQKVIHFLNCFPSGIRPDDDEAERKRKELARKEKLERAEDDPNELVFGRAIDGRGKWEIYLKTQFLKSESHP